MSILHFVPNIFAFKSRCRRKTCRGARCVTGRSLGHWDRITQTGSLGDHCVTERSKCTTSSQLFVGLTSPNFDQFQEILDRLKMVFRLHSAFRSEDIGAISSNVVVNHQKLENVAIANALQLEAARCRAVPLRFNFVARAKFEVAQPIRCRLRAFLLRIRYVML